MLAFELVKFFRQHYYIFEVSGSGASDCCTTGTPLKGKDIRPRFAEIACDSTTAGTNLENVAPECGRKRPKNIGT